MWKRLRSKRVGSKPTEDYSDSSLPTGYELRGSAAEARSKNSGSAGDGINDEYTSQRQHPSPSPSHQWQRSQDRRDDPLGLTVLYEPDPKERSVDILFIHGLGGTSLRTWCKNRDLDLLWPGKWLPADPKLSTARILTFGYNAHFSARRQQTSLTIGDFANDLLFSMKYGGDGDGDVKMGEVPIIVVAHSLGGLVFKKAFIHGHLSEGYGKIVSNIKAVLFMGTPHRGADLADTLNRVLSSSIFGHSPREYISELAKNSPTIDDLNESFRDHASKLHIFSFYETLGTAVGPVTTMIVPKQSSLLGYKDEIPQPLKADHHDVCKFTSPEDPNYRSVRGALRSLVGMLRFSTAHDGDAEKDLGAVGNWLNVTHAPEEDMAVLRSLWKPGTCESILKTSEFETWLESDQPHVLWVSAAPGSGKSIQSSFVVDYLLGRNTPCSYWFFKYGDARKRSVANMLRSMAYQMAAEDATFRHALVGLARSGIQMNNVDAAMVWRTVLAPRLRLFDRRVYWVVDGLDESESSRMLLDLISNLGTVPCNIGIIMFSRPLPTIIQSVQRAKRRLELTELTLRDNMKDIRLFLDDEMEDFLAADEVFKKQTVDEIAERAHGNFLWASLVTNEVVQCLRQEDVKRVLEGVPDGMDKLYDRMADAIRSLSMEADKHLSEILLSWAMYSTRAIVVEELLEPHAAELGTIMNLKHTVSQICGQFVVIDANNQLVLVHHTARQYLRNTTLLPFSLDASIVNEKLLITCLTALCDASLRTKLRCRKIPAFLPYAAISWCAHLDRCSFKSDTVLHNLLQFFDGDFPLTWIQYLAMSNQLPVLIRVSSSLNNFVRRRRESDCPDSPALHRASELTTLEKWALDLLRMTAKFGSRLVEDTEAIHKYIPALSPEKSIVHQKYAKKSVITVFGLTTTEWDDCVARVLTGPGVALHLAVSAQYLAVANDLNGGRGNIKLWTNDIFREHHVFHLDEPTCCIAFSPSGSLLACYGFDNTYIWRMDDMALVTSLECPYRERALALQFSPDETSLVVGTDLRHVFRLELGDTKISNWERYSPSLLEESVIPERAFINSPACVAFNTECTQVAVAYRGFPLTVWALDPPEVIARCKRKKEQGQTTDNTCTSVICVAWHPFDGQVLGIHRDGNIFKWSPIDNYYEELEPRLDSPSYIRFSTNGVVFATSENGAVQLYDYSQMVLIHQFAFDGSLHSVAFSPDARRCYDLREMFCNVWEPSCLMQIANGVQTGGNDGVLSSQSERHSGLLPGPDQVPGDASVNTSSASEAHVDSDLYITTIATCRNNHLLCAYATDDASVVIFDLARNIKHVFATSPSGVGVRSLALSPNGDLVAYPNAYNGVITVKRVDLTSEPGKASITTCWTEPRVRKRGSVFQLIFNNDCTRLFVSSRHKLWDTEKIQILDVEDGSVLANEEFPEAEANRLPRLPGTWEPSAQDPNILLGFTGNAVLAYSWDGFTLLREHPIDRSQDRPDVLMRWGLVFEGLQPSYCPDALIMETPFYEAKRGYIAFIVLDTSPLHTPPAPSSAQPDTSSPTIQEVRIHPTVARHIHQLLGILRDGRLVFLNENRWVCTAHMWRRHVRTPEPQVAKHFFIPRDWMYTADQMYCRVQKDGTLLVVGRGDLVVIRSDLGSDW